MTLPAISYAIARKHHYHRYRSAGYSALVAWNSARAHLNFMARLKSSIDASDKRSRAAKKAWRTRPRAD